MRFRWNMCSDEHQHYLIARDYNISLFKKQFYFVRSISRSEAKQVKRNVTKKSFKLVKVYNPTLNDLQKVIKNNLPSLYSDPDMKAVFPEGSINVTYKRGKNLKELILPSLFPQLLLTTKSQSMLSKWGRKWDISDNTLVCRNEFILGIFISILGLFVSIILSLDLGYIRAILTQIRIGVLWLNIVLTQCADADKLENIEVILLNRGKKATGTALIEKVIGEKISKTIFIFWCIRLCIRTLIRYTHPTACLSVYFLQFLCG